MPYRDSGGCGTCLGRHRKLNKDCMSPGCSCGDLVSVSICSWLMSVCFWWLAIISMMAHMGLGMTWGTLQGGVSVPYKESHDLRGVCAIGFRLSGMETPKVSRPSCDDDDSGTFAGLLHSIKLTPDRGPQEEVSNL